METFYVQHRARISRVVSVTCFATILFLTPSSLIVQAAGGNPINNPQAQYTLLEPLPCIASPALKDSTGKEIPGSAVVCNGQQKTTVNFQDYVQYAFNLLIALAAVAAVFMIVWGGFEHMTSTSPSGKTEGLKKLENAVYGLLLVLSSYLILRTIDPRLVQIPTTLVAPLNITYKPDEVANFFKQLSDDASKYRQENMTIINNVAAAQKEFNRLGNEKAALCKQLVEEEYPSGNPYGNEPTGSGTDPCLALTKLSGMSPEAKVLAAKIQDLDNKQTNLTTQIAANTAIGNMNAVIQKCYSVSSSNTRYWLIFNAETNSFTQRDCSEGISDAAAKGISILKANGQDEAANKIENYKNYADSITKINTAVKVNMSSSPDVKAAVDTLQTAVTTAASAAAAVYGGPVAAVGAFAGSQVFNGVAVSVLTGATTNPAAQLTVSQIQLEVNNNINTITDPKLQEQYKTQAYTLIKMLGGKGDGKDSTALAEKKITDQATEIKDFTSEGNRPGPK
jgi:hypothetical protein